MKKYFSLAIFLLLSGFSHSSFAAVLKNAEKGLVIVGVNTGKGWNAVKIMQGGTYSTGNAAAKFSYRNGTPVEAKATDRLTLQDGKITVDKDEKTAGKAGTVQENKGGSLPKAPAPYR